MKVERPRELDFPGPASFAAARREILMRSHRMVASGAIEHRPTEHRRRNAAQPATDGRWCEFRYELVG